MVLPFLFKAFLASVFGVHIYMHLTLIHHEFTAAEIQHLAPPVVHRLVVTAQKHKTANGAASIAV
jgi:hypothetical protein